MQYCLCDLHSEKLTRDKSQYLETGKLDAQFSHVNICIMLRIKMYGNNTIFFVSSSNNILLRSYIF